MIVRIVKLTFKTENIASFEAIFDRSEHEIRGFEGCSFLELYQDMENPAIFFTHSHWHSPTALDNYRHSPLFKEVWGQTKVLFSEAPLAWSVTKKCTLT